MYIVRDASLSAMCIFVQGIHTWEDFVYVTPILILSLSTAEWRSG